MKCPACKVIFTDLHCKAERAVRGVDLPAVLHNLKLSLYLDLSGDPGHSVDANPPVNHTRANPVPDSMTDATYLGGVSPPALERFRLFWPTEVEWIKATDAAHPYVMHRASLKRIAKQP
jgi:hypothetical protein